MNIRTAAAVLAIALGIAGCQKTFATVVPVTDDGYRITVQGNGMAKSAEVVEHAYYEAAKTTLARGARYFSVIGMQDTTERSVSVLPGSFIPIGGTYTYLPPQRVDTTFPSGDFYVRIHLTGSRPAGSFDAAEIVRNMGPRFEPKRS